MPEAQVIDQQQQGQQQVDVQQGEQKTSYTAEEWAAREADFNGKADKIRKNAERNTELRVRRELQPAQQPQQQAAPPAPKVEEAPKRDDFPDYETYIEAKADFAGRRAAREAREEARKEDAERQKVEGREKAAADFRERANKAATSTIPDFRAVVEAAEDVMITRTMADEIEDSPLGPNILYHLSHPDHAGEANRISKLPINQQIKEIAKLEAKIEAKIEAKLEAGAKQPDKDDDDQDGALKDDEPQGGKEAKSDDGVEKLDHDRNKDGTFRPKQGTRKAPEPIEPTGGRSANTSAAPKDSDPPNVWLEKRNAEIERERKVARGK